VKTIISAWFTPALKPAQINLRYFIDSFGCVKNQVDSENMMARLNNAGWECSEDAGTADMIIVNSCGFIESAKQESINAVLAWRKLYPAKKILLAGCLAQRYAKELVLPEADGFFGIQNIAQITEAAAKTMRTRDSSSQLSAESAAFSESASGLVMGKRPLLSFPGSAYVKISEGCDNRCSFCAIPLIRGNLVCRTIPDILDECTILLRRGIRELCLVGQDIGSFRLPELLKAISALGGNFWVRLLYIHPDHFPFKILDIIKKDGRFLPYFDLPFQHASEKILRAMNRRGTAREYLALLETIRSELPNAVIRSTFLLGFPGETEEDFSALLDFQQQAKLDWLGCFTYSREEGTAAYKMTKRVPAKKAAARKQIIEERQIPITENNMEHFTGQKLDLLLEEELSAESAESYWLGRLYCQAPEVDGTAVFTSNSIKLKAGNFIRCKVIGRRGFDLEVKPCE
jgi:ribosomal protein S12 methylthiotransferase